MFLGVGRHGWPAPVAIIDATDFKLLPNKAGLTRMVFENAEGKSLDIAWGRSGMPGTLLTFFKTHGKKNQAFQLVLEANNGHLMVQRGMCLNWDSVKNQFIKKKCSEAPFSIFDLYNEVAPPRIQESGEYLEEGSEYLEKAKNAASQEPVEAVSQPLFAEDDHIVRLHEEPADHHHHHHIRHSTGVDPLVVWVKPQENTQKSVHIYGRSNSNTPRAAVANRNLVVSSHRH